MMCFSGCAESGEVLEETADTAQFANGGKEGIYVTDYSYEKDLKGGVTHRYGKGSGYYGDDIIEDIYYAPVRVVK